MPRPRITPPGEGDSSDILRQEEPGDSNDHTVSSRAGNTAEEELPRVMFQGFGTLMYTDPPTPRWRLMQEAARRFQDDVDTSGIIEVTPTGVRQVPPSQTALYKAFRKVLETEMERVAVKAEISFKQGSRQLEYKKSLQKRRRSSLTPEQIRGSEVPIAWNSLTYQQKRGLINSELPGIVKSKDGTEISFRCGECEKSIKEEFLFVWLGGLHCSLHVSNLNACISCRHVNPNQVEVRNFDGSRVFICRGCIQNKCQDCGKKVPGELLYAGVCDNHLDVGNNQRPYRKFSRRLTHVSEELGAVVQSRRIFSAEIEGYTNHDKAHAVVGGIPADMGLGQDSSIRVTGSDWAFEVQTPRIAGKKGEALVGQTCSVLRAVNAQVNDSCGMHIHINAGDLFPEKRENFPTHLVQLMRTYLVFEDVILSFLPYSRRDNDYCRPLREAMSLTEVDLCETLQEVEALWYKERTYWDISEAKAHHHHLSRYFGVNFHSLLSDGHLEIRFHNGTINPRKILEWANLHLKIVDAVAAGTISASDLRHALNTTDQKQKTKVLFDLIGLAPSSQQYFVTRQNKFINSKEKE